MIPEARNRTVVLGGEELGRLEWDRQGAQYSVELDQILRVQNRSKQPEHGDLMIRHCELKRLGIKRNS